MTVKKLRTRHHTVVLSRSAGGDVGITIFLIILGVIMFLPLYYVVMQSFKPLDELFYYPPKFYVINPTWDNYTDLFTLMSESWVPFSRYIFNTVFITFCGTFGNLVLSSLCAYALSKIPFPGRKGCFWLVEKSLMIGSTVGGVITFILISWLGWMDTYRALFVPYMANVLYIYMLREFFMKVPKQLYYAAKIDGASDWKFLWSVMVPMAKSSIITICILVGINSWNAFLWPLLVTNSVNMRLVANGLTAFQSDAGNQYELLMAASTIITMPVVIVYIFLHKKIMRGISVGGIKG